MTDDKITRVDMGKAFNTWLKEQPESETSPIRKHTKALGEVSYALEALEKENLELKHQINELQLQVGDWKDAAEQTIAAARGTMIDAAGERQLRELVEERTELCKTVAFFASVIKSGESWSDTCQTMYDNTIIHLPSRK
jgi:phage shock protein A